MAAILYILFNKYVIRPCTPRLTEIVHYILQSKSTQKLLNINIQELSKRWNQVSKNTQKRLTYFIQVIWSASWDQPIKFIGNFDELI